MKIGFAKKVITPQLPCKLAGYAAERTAFDILDDVYVKVMVIEHKGQVYGVVAYDVCAIDDLLISEVKNGISSMGLHPDHFLFIATHTHSSFGKILNTNSEFCKPMEGIFISKDMNVIQKLANTSINAVNIAYDNLTYGYLKIAEDCLHEIGNNRNSLALPGNDTIFIIYAIQHHGKKAVLTHFACHPTVLNDRNTSISADFPGAIDAYLGEQGFFMNIFMNGSCGDISTRFSRKGSGYDEVKRYGRMFVDKIMQLYESADVTEINHIDIHSYVFDMRMKQPDTIEHATKALKLQEQKLAEANAQGCTGSSLRLIESYVEGAQANLCYAKAAPDSYYHQIKYTIWCINDHYAVCIPGELFSELSNPLQDSHTHFIGYANGYLGYFADDKAYEELYYEALSSPFQKGEPQAFINTIKAKLQMLKE